MQGLSVQVEQFAALGHPLRLAILRQLIQGDPAGTPAGEIQAAVGVPASTLSHHLGTLGAARLVAVERQGTTLRYRADFDTLRALTVFLWGNCCGGGALEADLLAEACCVPSSAAAAPAAAAPGATPRPSSRPWCPDFD